MKRRDFLTKGLVAAGFFAMAGGRSLQAAEHRYQLASEEVLPADIRRAPVEIREAYRFAIANREILRYIPCYCGCGSAGHTSNLSCYIKDTGPSEKLEFDRMSLG